MFRFSLPLLPIATANWFLAVGDRWILEIRYDDASVGLYQAAFTVVGLLSLPLAAFNQAFPPWAFSIHREPQARVQLRRAFALVVGGTAMAACVVSLLAPTVVRILAQPEFASARTMVPYLAFSLVAQGVFSFTAIGCNIAERNGPIAWAVLAGGASIVPVVLIFDRWMGADAVALSTLTSQTITAILVTRSAERLWPVRYNLLAPALAGAVCVGTLIITT
jgi:O-antigen/teichoic acid export membrane protein